MDNLKLWNKVCETNPEHTKKVTFGRGFTAIDPMHQVRNATEQFGAAGEGWGWEVSDTKFLPTDQVCVLVRLWHTDKGHIEQWGQCGMYIDNKKEKADGDCMKKATTDGLTKCLSYLGFNADVFLGKFDDNKYVAEMEQRFTNKEIKEELNISIDKIKNESTEDGTVEVGRVEWERIKSINGCQQQHLDNIKDQVEMHKMELQKAGAEPLDGESA